MAKYILLVNWTDQGIRNIKESAKRLDAGRGLAKEHGCVLENFFMTMGGFDNVALVDAPDDESLAKYVLTLGSEGNLRTVTLKAFPEETYRTNHRCVGLGPPNHCVGFGRRSPPLAGCRCPFDGEGEGVQIVLEEAPALGLFISDVQSGHHGLRAALALQRARPKLSARHHVPNQSYCFTASLTPSLPHGEGSHSTTRGRSLLAGVAERSSFAWG